jgi:hypothetical protein
VVVVEGEKDVHTDNGKPRIVATYDYQDEHGNLLLQVCRMEPKDFRQRRPDGNGGWKWSTKDAGGAGKWRADHARYLAGRQVVVIPDGDEPGRKHAGQVAASLH